VNTGVQRGARLLVLVAALFCTASASAHDLALARGEIVLLPDGGFRVELELERDAALFSLPPQIDAPAVLRDIQRSLAPLDAETRERRIGHLRGMVSEQLPVLFDGVPADLRVEFPDRDSAAARERPPLHVLGRGLELSGHAPPDARQVWLGGTFAGTAVLTLRWESETEGATRIVQGGARMEPFELDRPRPSRLATALSYARLGFLHILPLGLDHILFVLGLFFLSARLRPLLWQVTTFSLAHSLTLGLSMFGLVSAPAWLVEPLIAASIAWVAVENLVVRELTPWRPFVVLGFGLLHGLGFAGVLSELGLPRASFATALVGFNVGVELGQLAVLALAFAAVGWLGQRAWYQQRVAAPASILIAAAGAYWTATRVASALA